MWRVACTTTDALSEAHLGRAGRALAVAVQSWRNRRATKPFTKRKGGSAAGIGNGAACAEEVLGLAPAHGILDGTAGGLA